MIRAVSLVMVLSSVSAFAASADELTWHRVVGLLQYIEGDYAAALESQNAAELAEQRGFADEVVQALKTDSGALYRERGASLASAIEAGKPAAEVTGLCHALARDIIAEQKLTQAPKEPPDIAAGATLFSGACATCHGARGDGQSAAAAAMNPKPANFHDAERMASLTPYKVFNTTTFGVVGTPMPPFSGLSDAERWNVSFYIFTLRQPDCRDDVRKRMPKVRLAELATSTDDMLSDAYGADAVPCLRRESQPIDASTSLEEAIAGVEHSLQLSSAGQHGEARQALVDAYLRGVEPAEPKLRARDPKLVAKIEAAFTSARLTAQRGEDLRPDGEALLSLLRTAAAQKSTGDFWSVFITAMFILLREGFEAAVVVGALLAVLKKMGATEQARVVHFGWVAALVVSAALYFFGQKLLAGANREWMEAVVSLLAVGMLLYAAIWLNARANMSKFMGELRAKMKTALGSGSSFGLFAIAFSSVGRETLETALFLEGLAGDSPRGVSLGALAGLGALAVLFGVIRKVGFVLPMKTLFKASTLLLLATAVMLVGKGVHGLQELDVLPLKPVAFITLDALGIFADAYSLGAQLALTAALVMWLGATKAPTRVAVS